MAKTKKEKILVAMSGGVDSSVAATLLVKAGYDVTGAFMVNYDAEVNGQSCWHADYQDALRVAAKLKIPLLRLDFVKEYKKMVLDYCFKQYSAGRTPNPDILCNKFVKFGAWLKKAKELGFDKLATGHYARCHSDRASQRAEESLNAKYKLTSAKDTNKDQTYFLHQLNQSQLSRVLFPLGNYTKPQVRILAKKFNLPTADKAESMGICFVGEVPMREFLKGKVKAKPGKIISTTGELLGEHDGLPFYTIGERVGGHSIVIPAKAGIQSQPLFVIEKNLKKNTIIVGLATDPLLFKKEITVSNINWIAGQTPNFPLKCKVRLRHRQELQDCVIFVNSSVIPSEARADEESPLQRDRDFSPAATGIRNDNVVVKFTTPQRAVTPGQFAVFYRARRSLGEGRESFECLGGGEVQ